ncbi:MAG: DUF6261 family protein [Prevotellaceae bacterium]|jgi:hypothetical protein|nr:DUF6261 family protein [Prevotellaceae bacterium]
MEKFIALNVSHLRLGNLAGLTSETIVRANAGVALLNNVDVKALDKLTASNGRLISLMDRSHASPLTPLIAAKDKERDVVFSDIKRTVAAARKSTVPATAAAGIKLSEFLDPIWSTGTSPMMTQTTHIDTLKTRYQADTVAVAAAATLGLTPVMAALFTANTALFTLYNQRLDALSAADSPAASSVKDEVVEDYDNFCTAIELHLFTLPVTGLAELFSAMNDIRRRYISHQPVPLTPARTSVAPIPEQVHTGKHITPLPRVFYQADTELRELVFSEDFDVTYRNNIEVGEAHLFIHGKGKYTGRYDSTFHIVAS